MDMDRKQRVADALGMTLAEVEDMGGIEWAPLECEAKGYVDPRKEGGDAPQQASWLESTLATTVALKDYQDAEGLYYKSVREFARWLREAEEKA